MAALLAVLLLLPPLPAMPDEPPPAAERVRTGTVSHMGQSYGRHYLALPEHRWGRPGIPVVIKGPGGSIARISTDAGPDKAMQRAGRIADLSWWDFMKVCGVRAGEPDPGLCTVRITYIGSRAKVQTQAVKPQPKPMPTLPPTDTAP